MHEAQQAQSLVDRQLWAVVLAHVGAVEEAVLPRDDEHHRVDLDALVLPEGDLRLADQLGYNLTDPTGSSMKTDSRARAAGRMGRTAAHRNGSQHELRGKAKRRSSS